MFYQTVLHFGFASRRHMNKAKVGRRYIAFVGAPMAAVAQGRESVPTEPAGTGALGFLVRPLSFPLLLWSL